MEKVEFNQPIPAYDPRWFVWTIMFLLTTGVGLVVYIIRTDTSATDAQSVVRHRPKASVTENNLPPIVQPTPPAPSN